MKLGINGMGRIGKLTLWYFAAHKKTTPLSQIVVNLGRSVGRSLSDIAQVVEKDSSYGRLSNFLHGYSASPVIENLNEAHGSMTIDGIPVRFLRTDRNPMAINWRAHGVRLVVDTTGVFNNPTLPPDVPGGALRGHLESGAEKVVLSAPFKIRDAGMSMPNDAVTTVMGINDEMYDPTRHHLVSAASCTTTCLAFMIKPILDRFGADRLLSASMVTVHAATGSQKVLDSVPRAGAKDLRKSRSVLNNIILTTTGAAETLKLVIPEMREIGFMAESVRVPTATGSLAILTLNLQAENGQDAIMRDQVNAIYQEASQGAYRDRLIYSDAQNVSSDMIGFPSAATIIEGRETHTRTAFVHLKTVRAPVTQVVIYGWYDNEFGSYTNMLGERIISIAEQMF